MPAKSAAKAEALEQELNVKYKGEAYTVPPANKWDLDAMEAYEDGRPISCIRAVLGPEQWSTFKAGKPDVDDFNDFVKVLFEASGTSEGES